MAALLKVRFESAFQAEHVPPAAAAAEENIRTGPGFSRQHPRFLM
jgi:hypothetical protein